MSDRFVRVLAVLAVVGLAGCFTPSVPIPPPEPEKMSFGVDLTAGEAQFSYEANASYHDAVVYVFNRDKGEGVITTARTDGSVPSTPPFPAEEYDQIVITFELETQQASTCVELHEGPSSSEYECIP
jgi:hypothetical protein